MILRRDSHYYINKFCTGNCIVKCCSISSPVAKDGFWIIFADLKDQTIPVHVYGQADLKARVRPVSKAFNKYLKLFA